LRAPRTRRRYPRRRHPPDRQRRPGRRPAVSKYASWTHGKLPLTELLELKRRGQRLAMVTAYDFPSGRIADEAGVELVLVGDSAGMVVLGNESTVSVTMEELLMLTRAVTRGAKRPLVIAD